MNREEAKKAAEVMMAYAEGKEIEMSEYDGNWRVIKEPTFNWYNNNYRIKKEPTYRPFKDREECWEEMQKHQPFGWLKKIDSGNYFQIVRLSGIYLEQAFTDATFIDGTIFGIKEE